MNSANNRIRRKKRIKILFFILTLLFISLLARLIWIQIVNNNEYYNRALKQRMKEFKVIPDRGRIYDINGKELAVSVKSKTVVGLPKQITNPAQTARELADILSVGYDILFDRLTRDAYAVYLERIISDQKAEKIRSLNLKGITFIDESKRIYPKDQLAGHLIGFTGIDENGLEGVELSFDRYLTGTQGRLLTESDAAGKIIPESILDHVPKQDGNNVYLTINEALQHNSERELASAVNQYDAQGGTIIIMEPKTGNIVSMANYPDYNPNQFSQYNQKSWRNRAITDNYEPGSTFKIITTASALEEGVVNENDIFFDSGEIKVGVESIECWKEGGHGIESFKEVVKNSCNPGFVQLGLRMGRDTFYNYIDAFGFGQKTNIDLPGEAVGILPKYENINDIEIATMAFGMGISVTPIQLITAVSAVANNGVLMKPNIIDKITDNQGKIIKNNFPVEIKKAVSSNTADHTLNLLENVVSQGTGLNAFIDGYRVGGKTGTAEYYNDDIYDSSFIGVFPVNNPRYVVLVVLYGIRGRTYFASQTAAPLFKKIANDLIRYYKIPREDEVTKENDPEIETVKLKDLTQYSLYQAKETLNKEGINFKVIGGGESILFQNPRPNSTVYKDSTVFLFTERDQEILSNYSILIPDFRKMKAEEVRELAQKIGLQVSFQGSSGTVIGQTVEPGERLKLDDTIILKLAN